MAISVFKCDTCNREIQRVQNKVGIEVVGRCVITDGCRGKLGLVTVKPSHAMPKLADSVISLTDWTPRKALYTHTQEFLNDVWTISHELGTHPTVTTYVYVGDSLIRANPTIEPIDANTTILTFPTARSGVAQCISRSSSTGSVDVAKSPVVSTGVFSQANSTPITVGEEFEITIASRIKNIRTPGFLEWDEINVRIQFLSQLDQQPVSEWESVSTFPGVNDSPVDLAHSPWAGISRVSIEGNRYLLRSAHKQGSVPTGTAFFMELLDSNFNPMPCPPGSIYILLANAPYTEADRVDDKVIDMSLLTREAATQYGAAIDDSLCVSVELHKQLYPSMIAIN